MFVCIYIYIYKDIKSWIEKAAQSRASVQIHKGNALVMFTSFKNISTYAKELRIINQNKRQLQTKKKL